MSHVADILLLTSIEDPGIEDAQKWLRENNWPALVEISDHAGGNKVMQCEVWSAAINYFAIEDFVAVVKGIRWEWPESVQLLVKDEHEDHFTLRTGISANKQISNQGDVP
jgi:inhibitor of KinA sporulation pathway (predicted exonuclease)